MSYATDGYAVLHDVIPETLRVGLERSITDAYLLQARKVMGDKADDLDSAVGLLEDHDREAGYQALGLIAQSGGARALAAWSGFRVIASDLTGWDLSYLTPPSPFVNLPHSQRLLYHWHAEAHYYPKRRRLLNFWMPLFAPKNADNGTMYVARGSHLLGELPFAEYRGYDVNDVGKPNHFVQYEIPESFIAGCEQVAIDAIPGDLVCFDRRTVHASSANLSPRPSYAAVLRAWDPSTDLTLSGNIAATPYGGDYGRPGLTC